MRHKYPVIIALVVVTLAIYGRALQNDFVSLDDYDYVVRNPRVQAGLTLDSIRWAFTATHSTNWHPLTWLSHMADCQLYGLAPRGHHLTSILIHAANAALLLLFLAGATGALWQSAFVAALFALHPLHVESVAWVAERKDVLSTFFFLLTLLSYSRYVRRPGTVRYLAVFAAFALGLMAKPMLVTLPFVLLLLDYWPLGRVAAEPGRGILLRRLVLEKVPLLALSFASSLVTFYAQKSGGAVVSVESAPFANRVTNALAAYGAYLMKMVWPRDLAVLYPLTAQVPLWQVAGSLLLLAGVTAAAFRLARRAPYLPVGWLWYLGTLVPVIGLVQVGVQSMADRYTYVPLIGIFVMVAWGVPELFQGWRERRLFLAASAAALLVTLAALTWHQIGYWRDNLTLFGHTLRVTSGNFTIQTSMGIALADRGDLDAAISHYEEALQINPSYELAHVHLAFALFSRGKTDEAIGHYLEALRLKPADALAHNNLGIALSAKGDVPGAIDHFAAAARFDPDYGDAHYNLALALARQGKFEEAVREYLEAQRINPNDPDIRRNLEIARSQLQKGPGVRNR